MKPNMKLSPATAFIMLLVGFAAAQRSNDIDKPVKRSDVLESNSAVATVSFRLPPPKHPIAGREYPHTILYVVNYSDVLMQLALNSDVVSARWIPREFDWALHSAINEKVLRYAVDTEASDPRHKCRKLKVMIETEAFKRDLPSPSELEDRILKGGNVAVNGERLLQTYSWERSRINRYLASHTKSASGARILDTKTREMLLETQKTEIATLRRLAQITILRSFR